MTNHILKHDNKILQGIKTKLDELQYFNQLLTQHLDPAMAKHCQVIKFDKNCLILMMDNGHWTTQLRFQIPDLLSTLRQYPKLANVNGIICKTRPPHTIGASNKRKPRSVTRLSTNTAETVLRIAESIQDPRLRKILEKIAMYSMSS